MSNTAFTADELAIASRREQLDEYGYNVFSLPPDIVKFEFKTDSWIEILTEPMRQRLSSLQEKIDYQDRADHSAEIFAFEHFIYVAQGRSAEAYYWKVDNRKDKTVVTNLLFPTSRQHIIMNRMTPVECPVPHVFDKASDDIFRGNLDCQRLRRMLQEDADSIAYVYMEAENNASGGYPVAMSNAREVHDIVAGLGIKMVLDATRLVENCIMIQQHEPGYQDRSIATIMGEFCSFFDSMTNSLAKDFGIDRGGLIAVNDERMYYRAKDVVAFYGPGISITDRAMINAAMKDREFIELMAQRRVSQAARIHQALLDNSLPVVSPAGGHCVLLDVEQYMDVSRYRNAVTSFTAYLYERAGVRGGIHLSGMMKQYCKLYYVRFAIPLCMTDEAVDAMIAAFVDALLDLPVLPDMEKASSLPGLAGMLNARYKPVALGVEHEAVSAKA